MPVSKRGSSSGKSCKMPLLVNIIISLCLSGFIIFLIIVIILMLMCV
jgi:hypothetical protein